MFEYNYRILQRCSRPRHLIAISKNSTDSWISKFCPRARKVSQNDHKLNDALVMLPSRIPITQRVYITEFSRKANNLSRRSASTLVLLRHGKFDNDLQWRICCLYIVPHAKGKSIWNGACARFTGWCDIPLTVQGRVEAVAAGQLLRSRGLKASKVCVAFVSELERSHETCELALASMAGHEQDTWSTDRIRREWRLNERHYGAVQGRLKSDPRLIKEYGEDTVINWRRSLKGKPVSFMLKSCSLTLSMECYIILCACRLFLILFLCTHSLSSSIMHLCYNLIL